MTSIIVITYNNLELTNLCIESIKKYTKDYELIVIDNGSSDGTLLYLCDNSNKQIFNKENLGFVKAVNQGLELATGDYICLLNNDVIVSENWLDDMLKYYKTFNNLGIIGAKSNKVSGWQKEYSYIANGYDEICLKLYAKDFRNKNYKRIRISPRITGLCMLFPKKVLELVGNFDESFGMGNYEDDDFSLRVHTAGYTNIIAEDVFVYHFGSASFSKDPTAYNNLLKTNGKVFEDKWGESAEIIWDRIYGE